LGKINLIPEANSIIIYSYFRRERERERENTRSFLGSSTSVFG